ncbi:MAG: hypothetical protein Q8S31_03190 [Alphaproteobacteria bacterium]|nr:hypothetical protein [Alphaproteobacteria bacterium]
MRIALFLLTILSTSICLAFEPEIVHEFSIKKDEEPNASLRELKDREDNQYIQNYQEHAFKFHVSEHIKNNKKDLTEDEYKETHVYKTFVNRVNEIANDMKEKFHNNMVSLIMIYLSEQLVGGTYYRFEDNGIIRMLVSCVDREADLPEKKFWRQLINYLANADRFPGYNSLIVMVKKDTKEHSTLLDDKKLKFEINPDYTDPTRPASLFTAFERKF